MENKITEFKKFLIANNAKVLYITHYKKRRVSVKLSLLDFLRYVDKSGWLHAAFQWHKTFDGGLTFWHNLDQKWQKQLNK